MCAVNNYVYRWTTSLSVCPHRGISTLTYLTGESLFPQTSLDLSASPVANSHSARRAAEKLARRVLPVSFHPFLVGRVVEISRDGSQRAREIVFTAKVKLVSARLGRGGARLSFIPTSSRMSFIESCAQVLPCCRHDTDIVRRVKVRRR